MQAIQKNGLTSVILRVKIADAASSSGGGKTGLSNTSSGLIISTIADVESAATCYTAQGSTIDVATIGGYVAPASGHCRFAQVDSIKHPGLYEIQLADARYAVSGARSLVVTLSGASGMMQTDTVVQCDAGTNNALPTVDASNNVHGLQTPVALISAGDGPYALTTNGGTGAGGAAITSNGPAIGTDGLRVVDSNGNGIDGAVLRLYLASDSTFSNMLGTVTTGQDGRWLAPIYCNSGSYQLVTSAFEEQSAIDSIVVP